MHDLPDGLTDYIRHSSLALSAASATIDDHPLTVVSDGFCKLTGDEVDVSWHEV